VREPLQRHSPKLLEEVVGKHPAPGVEDTPIATAAKPGVIPG
jgi:hypothetical protein